MMRHAIASGVVTFHDLHEYFVGEEHGWRSKYSHGKFTALSEKKSIFVEISPISTLFDVHIEAVDDPYDFEDFKTDKPMETVIKFLSREVPGGEDFFKKVSINDISQSLQLVNFKILSGKFSKQQTKKFIRRISTLLLINKTARDLVDDIEIPKLKKEFLAKGWKVEEIKDKNGIPALKVDIQHIFSAEISVNSVKYKYFFEVPGQINTEGESEDPIAQFEKWVRDPKTKAARQNSEASRPTEPSSEQKQNAPTVAPKHNNV